MPLIGLGVFKIPDLNEFEKTVLTAIKAGYLLIDTAAVYQNESAVGYALKKAGLPVKSYLLLLSYGYRMPVIKRLRSHLKNQ